MKHKAIGILTAIVTAMAFGQASAGVVFQDLPVANSNFISHHAVGGPVLADDFIPGKTGAITSVDWWGSAAQSLNWEITLHLNADANPAAPDLFPANQGGFKLFVSSAGTDPDADGIFQFSAAINDPNWSVVSGNSYWFSAANFLDGWTWAVTDGLAEVGNEIHSAVGSIGSTPCPDGGPHCGAWNAIQTDLAFRITVVPEPGALTLLGAAMLAGLLISRRRGR